MISQDQQPCGWRISQPLVHTATMISPWFHRSQKTWATGSSRIKKPDGLLYANSAIQPVYIWYITISVDSGTCGGFFRLVFAGHVTHITKKTQSPRAFRLEKHQQLEPSIKIWDTPHQVNQDQCFPACWHMKNIFVMIPRDFGETPPASLPRVYLVVSWDIHPQGAKATRSFNTFWGTPWINSVHSTPVSGWTEWAVF